MNIDFPSAAGAFDQFATPAVRCTPAPGLNALYATNQYPRMDDPSCGPCERRLAVGFAFGDGYAGPGRLLTCDFRVGERSPRVGDFSLTVVDAVTVNGLDPIVPPPRLSVRGLAAD